MAQRAGEDMTPTRFRIVKHLTATLFALTAVGILVLGFDGLLRAMRKLTLAITPPPAAAPAVEAPMSPGVVPAFVVPAEEPAGPSAPGGPGGGAAD
jgi:hypothetical protein